jgi:hypothetical protein
MSGKAFSTISPPSMIPGNRGKSSIAAGDPALILCGTLAGAEDFVEIERWGRRKLDFLRRLPPFVKDIASHDTLNDVMNALPAALFRDRLARDGPSVTAGAAPLFHLLVVAQRTRRK